MKHAKDIVVFDNHVKKFLEMFMEQAGETCMTSKLHGLAHVADDLKLFKCQLYAMSAYEFENAIGEIRRKLRSGNKPLQQMRYYTVNIIITKNNKAVYSIQQSSPPEIMMGN